MSFLLELKISGRFDKGYICYTKQKSRLFLVFINRI